MDARKWYALKDRFIIQTCHIPPLLPKRQELDNLRTPTHGCFRPKPEQMHRNYSPPPLKKGEVSSYDAQSFDNSDS